MNYSFILPGLPALAGVLCCLAAAWYYYRRSKAFVNAAGKTRVIGITGTIASGKSLVGSLLEECGIPVLDTDHIAHDVQANDPELKQLLRERFGESVFDREGKLDRKKLGAIVFNDRAALNDLNAIVHPAVLRECRKRIAALAGEPLVAVLVPLLFEARLASHYDEIWTVTASDAVVKERLKAREGISDEEAEKRLRAQFSQAEKIAGSDHVIDNSGTINDTRKQVLALLELTR